MRNLLKKLHLPTLWTGAATHIIATCIVLIKGPSLGYQPIFWIMEIALFLAIVWLAYLIGKGKERPEKIEDTAKPAETEPDVYHLANVLFFPETGAIKFEFSDGGAEEITTQIPIARLPGRVHGIYGVGSNLLSCVMHLALHNFELEKRVQRLEETRRHSRELR